MKKPQRHISIHHHIKLIRQKLTWMQLRLTVAKHEWWWQLVHTLINKQWHIQSSQTDSITKYYYWYKFTQQFQHFCQYRQQCCNQLLESHVGQLLSLNVKDILKEMFSQPQSDNQKKENFTRSQIRGIQTVRNCFRDQKSLHWQNSVW